MCGRFVSRIEAALEREWELKCPAPEFSSYNVAPGADIPVVRPAEEGGREIVLMRWGLIPYWAEDARMAYKTIIARAESIFEKPTFREAFKRHRCLIPANGFYEWQKTSAGKVPYYVYFSNRSMMAIAGIWDVWQSPEGERIESCAIITTPANKLVERIHNRMPVIIARGAFDVWLTGSTEDVAPLMMPYRAGEMAAHPVSPYVNKTENDDPQCIEPISHQEARDLLL